MMNSIFKNSSYTLISIIILIILWRLASTLVNLEIILPSPETTLITIMKIIKSQTFISIVSRTLVRFILGFLFSLTIGIILGFVGGFYTPLYHLLQPLIISIRSTPVVSIILLALIWLKTDIVPILVSFLVVFPIIYGNIVEGIKNVDTKLLEMAKMYKIKKIHIIKDIYLPSILPYLIAGISTALGLNMKVIIAAEVLSQPRLAIGTQLFEEKIYLETAGVLAWTVIAITLSFLFDKIAHYALKRLQYWK